MTEIREAPFTLRFSAYRMMAEFTAPGQYIDLIDFDLEINRYLPAGSSLISANIELVKFQCTHYLPSLYRAQAWSRADPELDNPADLLATEAEWQRKHSIAAGYAVQISIAEFTSDSQWHTLAFKNLYNTGLENYVNLLNPMMTLGERDYFDLRCFLGFRIAEIPPQIEFQGRDRISITGAATVYVTYEYNEPLSNIFDENKHVEINNQDWTQIFTDRTTRVGFYLSNLGGQPIHFVFTKDYVNANWSPEHYPFVAPGESLTFENGQFFGGEGKLLRMYAMYANQNLYCRTVSGTSKVSCQQFYMN